MKGEYWLYSNKVSKNSMLFFQSPGLRKWIRIRSHWVDRGEWSAILQLLRVSGESTVLPCPALFSDTSIGDRRSPVPSLASRSTVDIFFVWTPIRAWVSSCACSIRSMWEDVMSNMTAAKKVKRNVNQGRTTAILTIQKLAWVKVKKSMNNTKTTYNNESAYKHSLYPGHFLQYWQCNLEAVFHPDRR